MGHSRIARIKEISECHSVTIENDILHIICIKILFYILPNRLIKCY